ncbi:MAG: AAA family ATPase [Deltaproteobacteria bacterium]|nr:AAA family ATPase [Deltaproteobacteria bacterium]
MSDPGHALVTVKNNPAFLADDALIGGFVVRRVDLEQVMEAIADSAGGPSRHVLVIGPRGMGKTTLVLRAAAEVRRDSELQSKWYPVIFAEESYSVLSAGELWLEAVSRLADQTGEPRWRSIAESLRSIRDEQDLRDRALARLMDFADERGVRLLLVIENLNMLFSEQLSSDDAWVLRHTFQNEPRILVLATATQRFDQIDDVDKAFFELMRVVELPPLTNDECRVLWHRLTGELLEGDRVRPVRILTGGNTRLVAILASFARDRSLVTLMRELVGLIDEYTIYFKANLEGLPATERKVFVALCDIWQPATAREVSERTRLPTNTCSALLKRLVSRGAVVEAQRSGRRTWYQVAERLYNIYHLMRVRGGEADRVRALVEFMVHLYGEREEFGTLAAGVLHEACGLDPAERRVHLLAFSRLVEALKETSDRELLLKNLAAELADLAPELPDSLRRSPELRRAWRPPEGAGWEEWQTYLARVGEISGDSAEDISDANSSFEQLLLATDPPSPVPWLALAHQLMSMGGPPPLDRIRRAVERARDIDADLSEVRLSEGLLAALEGDYGMALSHFRDSLGSAVGWHVRWSAMVAHLGQLRAVGHALEPLADASVEARQLDERGVLIAAAVQLARGEPAEADESLQRAFDSAVAGESLEWTGELLKLWGAVRLVRGFALDLVLAAFDRFWPAAGSTEYAAASARLWPSYVAVGANDPDAVRAHLARRSAAQGLSEMDRWGVAFTVVELRRAALVDVAVDLVSPVVDAKHEALAAFALLALGRLHLLGGRPDDALATARILVEHDPDSGVDCSDLFIELAAAGLAKPAAALLADTEWARRAEPLLVALRLEAGDEVMAPQEVLEVATDLRERIARLREHD